MFLDISFWCCQTMSMLAKKARKTASKATPERKFTRVSTDLSYETKLTIVVLLLLFFYPLGLIFMWAWMRSWPTWLKLLLSIPVAIGLCILFAGIMLIIALVRNGASNNQVQEQLRVYQQLHMQKEVLLTPTESEIEPTDTPATSY